MTPAFCDSAMSFTKKALIAARPLTPGAPRREEHGLFVVETCHGIGVGGVIRFSPVLVSGLKCRYVPSRVSRRRFIAEDCERHNCAENAGQFCNRTHCSPLDFQQ